MELKIGTRVRVSPDGDTGIIIDFVDGMVHVHLDDADRNTVGSPKYLPSDMLSPIPATYEVCTIEDGEVVDRRLEPLGFQLERHPENIYLWRPVLVEGRNGIWQGEDFRRTYTVTQLSDCWMPRKDARQVLEGAKNESGILGAIAHPHNFWIPLADLRDERIVLVSTDEDLTFDFHDSIMREQEFDMDGRPIHRHVASEVEEVGVRDLDPDRCDSRTTYCLDDGGESFWAITVVNHGNKGNWTDEIKRKGHL